MAADAQVTHSATRNAVAAENANTKTNAANS